jgi:hypothetical protein
MFENYNEIILKRKWSKIVKFKGFGIYFKIDQIMEILPYRLSKLECEQTATFLLRQFFFIYNTRI